MHCYLPTCQYAEKIVDDIDVGLHMPEKRPYTSFCSQAHFDDFHEHPAPNDINVVTPRKHSIADVQRMLLEKAKTAPKSDPDPIVQEIIESHPVPTPPPTQSLLLPYADD